VAPSWRALFRYSHQLHKNPRRTPLFRSPVPNVAQRAGKRLWDFRYFYLPALRQRTQSRIWHYLVARRFRKQNPNATGVFTNLRRHGFLAPRPRLRKDGAVVQRLNRMAYTGPSSSTAYNDFASMRSEPREVGYKRKKIANFLKAANEVRQSYFNGEGGARDVGDDAGIEGPGAFPDAAVIRSGNEEMILFPSYARRHVKSKVRRHA